MAIDVTFKILKIGDGREATNWYRVSQARSAGIENY